MHLRFTKKHIFKQLKKSLTYTLKLNWGGFFYFKICDANLFHFKKAINHFSTNTSRFIQADLLFLTHFLPTQNLSKIEKIVKHYFILPISIIAANIEKSLTKILEAIKGIKDYISDFEVRNICL